MKQMSGKKIQTAKVKAQFPKTNMSLQLLLCIILCVYETAFAQSFYYVRTAIASIFSFNFKSGTTDPATDDKSLLRLKNVDSIRKYSLTKLAIGWCAYIVQRQSLKAF